MQPADSSNQLADEDAFQFEYSLSPSRRWPDDQTERDAICQEAYDKIPSAWKPLREEDHILQSMLRQIPRIDAYTFMQCLADGEFDDNGCCSQCGDVPTTIDVVFPPAVSGLAYHFVGDNLAPVSWTPDHVAMAVFEQRDAADFIVFVRNIVVG